jgi:hypothetical protein
MALTSICNISKQVVPILINEVALESVDAGSEVASTRSEQMHLPPGSEVEIETSRIDIGQLEQLQRLQLLTFIAH